ncbi:ribosome small subunit-dependent GTPase A [Paenibacillus sp. GCM10023252]|uniref:ribosome small subunit-dependent GTPase A n=1 Tax=Paenibacillus sp. GCM10023252 TaxID=3252649 RepID=UPI00360B94D2
MTITNKNKVTLQYGWNEAWEEKAALVRGEMAGKELVQARVCAQYAASAYRLISDLGDCTGEVSGKFRFLAVSRSAYPAVGDWVMVEWLAGEPARAVIHSILPRKSAMTRRAAGSVPEEQVIGANLNYLFITSALNQDFNLRKIERYMVAAWESGAAPVILLTKSDLCEDARALAALVEEAAPGVPVHVVSALHDEGREQLSPYLAAGNTIAVTGSSGVGKSTLLNWLAGDELQHTGGIREDDARGRHTTTHRELFLLPGGALMLDTPGMRELQLWEADEGWQQAFVDIEGLAADCRFRDCKHEAEADCAVQAAISTGELDHSRFTNYKKTERELARLARKEQRAGQRRRESAAPAAASRKRERRIESSSWEE